MCGKYERSKFMKQERKIHLGIAYIHGGIEPACNTFYYHSGEGIQVSTFWENITCKKCLTRVCRCSYEAMVLSLGSCTKELREKEIAEGWYKWKGTYMGGKLWRE
jgi:hypothetical protein